MEIGRGRKKMEILIYSLKKEQAIALEGFVLPGVLELPDSEKFWYFLAVDEMRTPMGMTVVAPYQEEAELLSIGISEKFIKKGVATELISYTLEKLRETKISGIRVTYTSSPFWGQGMERFLERNGFYLEEENNTFVGTLEELNQHPHLKEDVDYPQIRSLSSLSDGEMRTLELMVSKKELFDPQVLKECDVECSFLWKEEEIEALFLLSDLTEGKLTNLYTWLGSNTHKKLLGLMKKSLKKALSCYPKETEVIFTCTGTAAEKMVSYFLPSVKPRTILRSYYHGVMEEESFSLSDMEIEEQSAPKEAPDERRRAYWEDMKPQPATDEELWCKNCIFRKEENLLSCEKYRDKPGNVLYGGECPYFAERDLK